MSSRVFRDEVRALGEGLQVDAGSYLANVVRVPGVTCEVCATPVTNRYRKCFRCLAHAQDKYELADRVGSMVYAVEPNEQSYKVVSDYKSARPGQSNVRVMRSLLAIGLKGHFRCALRLADSSDFRWAVVPSTQGRSHLIDYVRQIARHSSAHELRIEVGDRAAGRRLDPHRWRLPEIAGEAADHVLVIDDSWVSGGHAQSLAAALKVSGVRQVSILTVARVLNPQEWAPAEPFVKEYVHGGAFDWSRCPWTGTQCPMS